jgi:hypothetical protein
VSFFLKNFSSLVAKGIEIPIIINNDKILSQKGKKQQKTKAITAPKIAPKALSIKSLKLREILLVKILIKKLEQGINKWS